jgi:hypothetical protein
MAVCQAHGAGTSLSKRTSQRREVTEKLVDSVQKILDEQDFPVISDPFTALAELAGEILAFKNILRDKVNELTDWRSYGGVAGEQVDVLIQTYERALDRTERTLSKMSSLDLTERIAHLHARIDETTVKMIDKAMKNALGRVDVTDDQKDTILRVLGEELRDAQPPPLRQ